MAPSASGRKQPVAVKPMTRMIPAIFAHQILLGGPIAQEVYAREYHYPTLSVDCFAGHIGYNRLRSGF